MRSVVVLGMHRSGTSLVAGMLAAMGVDMGREMLGEHPSQPWGHFEDLDFIRMNESILADSGGTWDDPPEIDFLKFRPEVVALVYAKRRPELFGGEARTAEWWGWKDPRTCLTVGCYHQYLPEPHYIVVTRNKPAIVASLEWREGKAGDAWDKLADYYYQQVEWFLSQVRAPVLRLRYEDLVDADKLSLEALRLAEFLGMGEPEAEAAAQTVHTSRQRVDWRGMAGNAHQREVLNQLAAEVAANAEVANIIHLGQQDDAIQGACQDVSGRTKFVQVLPQWEKAWSKLQGPVQMLVVTEGPPDAEVRGWLSKVRPGGVVALAGSLFVHDWPETAWVPILAGGVRAYKRRPFLRAGDPWGTLGIGVPYFKASYEFWRWWSWILLRGLEDGDEFLNDESVMAPLPIPVVHNRLIARFLETDRDTFCIVEDDHTGDPQVIRQMREKAENRQFDIVTANYINRRADPGIVGYGLTAKPNRRGEYLCILDYPGVQETGTQAVDGSVMGLALIRRWVLDAMLAGGKPSQMQWCEWRGGNSQDVQFYGKAKEAGAKVAVDRDARIGHMAEVVKTVDEFYNWQKGR